MYEDTCKRMGGEPRYFIMELFRELEYSLQQGQGRLLLVDLPPGYGKSTATITLARYVIESNNEYFSRVIHVLPMRSIIEDLYCRVSDALKNHYNNVDKYLAKQYMFHPGSPLFAKRCVITTLDTFILNFFKLPAHELVKAFRDNISHFEFPRAMIYTSLVIFDEFHLFSGLGSINEEGKSFTAVLAAITSLLNAGVPIIVMTATMPPRLKEYLEEEVKQLGLDVKIIEYKEGYDKDFDERLSKKIKMVRRMDSIDEALEGLKMKGEYNGKKMKIAVILNTIDGAIDAYKRISREFYTEIILVHGRLPQSRRASIDELRCRDDGYILVATQVIEAGIDLNFDIMVTECCPADRLVQRSGRVARHSSYGEIWVFRARGDQPYDTKIIENTWNMLNRITNNLDHNNSKRLIYDVYKDIELTYSETLLRALKDLDRYPIFGLGESKKAFEYFNGFTDSAGIISIYKEGDYEPKNAIPLSNKEMNKLMRYNVIRFLTIDNKVITIDNRVKSHINRNKIPILMLKEGYKGIIVSEDVYNMLIGFDMT